MQQRVTMITLGVADLARSTRFYSALGWRKAEESQDGIVFFQLPGMLLGLFPIDELAKDQGRQGARLETGAMTLAHNLNSKEEVNTAYTEFLGSGGTPMKSPQGVFWGGYSGYAADPDGHVWEFAFNPFAPLATDGTLTLPSEAT